MKQKITLVEKSPSPYFLMMQNKGVTKKLLTCFTIRGAFCFLVGSKVTPHREMSGKLAFIPLLYLWAPTLRLSVVSGRLIQNTAASHQGARFFLSSLPPPSFLPRTDGHMPSWETCSLGWPPPRDLLFTHPCPPKHCYIMRAASKGKSDNCTKYFSMTIMQNDKFPATG